MQFTSKLQGLYTLTVMLLLIVSLYLLNNFLRAGLN